MIRSFLKRETVLDGLERNSDEIVRFKKEAFHLLVCFGGIFRLNKAKKFRIRHAEFRFLVVPKISIKNILLNCLRFVKFSKRLEKISCDSKFKTKEMNSF